MELVKWILGVGFYKGILVGMREYDYKNEEGTVLERDYVFYIPMIQIIVTCIYQEVE